VGQGDGVTELPRVLGAIHGLLLIALCWRSATRLAAGSVPRLCAAFLLVWCNLAYTALILAALSKLDRMGLYFGASLAAAAAVEALLHYRGLRPLAAMRGKVEIAEDRFDRVLRRVLGATLLLASLGSAAICYFYVPNNWDSCTYRFSRAFFYLGRGDLLHVGNPLDPRLLFYPFNGTLFYLFFAIYQFQSGWMYLVTCLGWVFAGLGSYFVARRLGASRTGSFAAAWICWLTPSVLAQAASTNDEVLAAVPLLLALGFAMEWLATAQAGYAVLAGIGLGLGFGSKLHWVFYSFFAGAAAILLAIRAMRNTDFRADLARRVPALLAACGVAAPLAGAFLVASYVSSGRLTDEGYNNAILNRPFRLSLAREKIRINTAELFVSPIPDLTPPVNREERKKSYAAFNQFFMKCCFSDLVETTKRSPEGYLFEGPADPEGAAPNEYTVWLGFMPHLLLLVFLVGVVTRKLPAAAVAIAGAFFAWHVTYAVENRFIPTASVYYSFPAVLAFGAFGPAWDFARNSRGWVGRLLLAGFLAVSSTHIVLGGNLLAFGGLRNLQFVWHKTPAPEMHPAAPGVVEAIRAARRIYIPYTHWEVLYWNFMRFNPVAKYSTGVDLRLPSPDTMMLLSVAREGGSDLIPARLPAGSVAGLTYLGDADSQPIFAQGGGVEIGRDRGRKYTLLPVWLDRDAAGLVRGLTMRVSRPSQEVICCVGLDASDGVEYRYELQSSTTRARRAHEWSRPGDPDPGISASANETYDTMTIETRIRQHPAEITRTVRRLNAGPYEIAKDEAESAGAHR
jgi:4-amino-4-deoxy-L-arabinose transferase-like glycosyltransferase